MMSRESFERNTSWKMSYEQYQKCYCPDCKKEECPHRDAYRRVPVVDGGLGLCDNLNEMKRYYCVESRFYDDGRIVSAIAFSIDSTEKPESIMKIEKDCDLYIDWFDSETEAKDFAAESMRHNSHLMPQ